jgi:peptidoglycan/LPS O-acetylase OafA/YrhL
VRIDSQSTNHSVNYRPDIDGLRAVSILAVLAFHAFPGRLKAGFIGVDVFFVISGYLIGGLVYSQVEKNCFSYIDFYVRRVRRIFPALLIVLITVYAIGWKVLFADEYQQLGKHIAGGAGFVSNFVFLGEVGYFDNEASTKPLLHLWSLAIEEQFYLFFPLFAGAFRRRYLFVGVALVLSLLSFALNVSLPANEAFYSPASRLWELAVGVVLSQAPHIPALRFLADPRRLVARNIAAGAGLAMIGAATVAIPVQFFSGWWALLPVFGSALVILCGPNSWSSRKILSHPLPVFIGLISYPLYLWHWPLLSFASTIYGTQPPTSVRVALLAASLVLAWLTYSLVERPIRKLPPSRRGSMSLAALVVLMGAVGLLTAGMHGIDTRQVAEQNSERAKQGVEPIVTHTSDGSCERAHGIRMEGDQVCLVNAPQPKFLFMGDSLSMAMYSSIFTGDTKVQAALVATHSHLWNRPECVAHANFATWMQGDEACEAVVRNALEILRREPTIKAIVLVSLNANPFFLSTEKLEGLYNEAAALGRKVVYVGVVPRFGQPPTACRPRVLRFFGMDFAVDGTNACEESTSHSAHQQDSERRIVANTKRDFLIYDPRPTFCGRDNCHQDNAGSVLFWRDAHVNVRGSALLLDDFLKWVSQNIPTGD